MSAFVCFTVRRGHAARPAICSLSVLQEATLSKQARAGEMLDLMALLMAAQLFPLPTGRTHTLALRLPGLCNTFLDFLLIFPPFSSPLPLFFSPVSTASDGRTQSHNAVLLSPAAHFDKAVSLSPSDGCSIVQ